MTDTERKRIFSTNLLNKLNKSGKLQIEVAHAIGVSQQTFNTWCRGVALPRMGKIQLLADYFNVDMADLIEERSAASGAPANSVPMELSPLEGEIVTRFRGADEFDQETVLRTLRIKREDYSSSTEEDAG